MSWFFTPKTRPLSADFVEILRKPMQWSTQPGWLCPKCGRAYGPSAIECPPCNAKVADTEKTKQV